MILKEKVILNQDKKKRKDKKKKKGKIMEDNKENLTITPGITMIYETLTEYNALYAQMVKNGLISDGQMHRYMETLYWSFDKYLLNKQQLAKNKFPVPGVTSGETFTKDGNVCRRCNRCGANLEISLDGKYKQNEECNYHPDRLKSYDYLAGTVKYKCCGKLNGSSGCQSHPGHVFSDPILQNVTFKNVREKRQVRAEHRYAVYALDCEMVYTNIGLQLAKIGIVNLEGLTVYETYVLPENEIIDYNTTYSGITAKDLIGVTTTLADVQTYLDQILNQHSILVGHGLENDMKMLRLVHDKIVDTSVVFPRSDGSKRKLKDLSLQYLCKQIQGSIYGHNCIEDARTCMALMLYKISEDGLQPTTVINSTRSFTSSALTERNTIQKGELYDMTYSFSKEYVYCLTTMGNYYDNYNYVRL